MFVMLFLIMSLTDSNFLSLRMRTLTNFEQERTCSRMHDISARRVLLGIKIVWYLDTIIIGRFEQSRLDGGRFKYLTWVVRVTFGSYNQ